jgi:hypothetical protein
LSLLLSNMVHGGRGRLFSKRHQAASRSSKESMGVEVWPLPCCDSTHFPAFRPPINQNCRHLPLFSAPATRPPPINPGSAKATFAARQAKTLAPLIAALLALTNCRPRACTPSFFSDELVHFSRAIHFDNRKSRFKETTGGVQRYQRLLWFVFKCFSVAPREFLIAACPAFGIIYLPFSFFQIIQTE